MSTQSVHVTSIIDGVAAEKGVIIFLDHHDKGVDPVIADAVEKFEDEFKVEYRK